MDKNIFISYSWKNEEVVNDIDNFLLSKGIKVIRDKRETNYKDSIKKFMKRLEKLIMF